MEFNLIPPGDPVPITASFGFVCKWCHEDRQMVFGYSAAHACTVRHTQLEDFEFVSRQIDLHWQSA
jgi:hypothetical protein